VLGLYISGHPLKEYEGLLKEKTSHNTAQLAGLTEGTPVVVGGVVAGMRKITTRQGEPMVFMALEDLLGNVEVVVFPRVYRDYASLVRPDAAVLVRGRVNFNSSDDEVKVIAGEIISLEERVPPSLHIKVPETGGEEILPAIQGVLRLYPGETPVLLFIESGRKLIRTRREWWVNLDSGVVAELVRLLGEGLVFVKTAD